MAKKKKTKSPDAQEAPKADTPVKTKSKFREYAEAIFIAILIALVIRTFVIQAYKIPSGSMIPSLLVGDHLLVNKFIYGVKIPIIQKTLIPITDPKPGDIIVFIYPEDRSLDYIKRVIGVAGDKIEIRDKVLFVNDVKQQENYTQHIDGAVFPGSVQPRDNFGPKVVPPDSLFVMGDNRDASQDSRFWGFVNVQDVRGKALILYWSWDRDRSSPRWNRMGNLLH